MRRAETWTDFDGSAIRTEAWVRNNIGLFSDPGPMIRTMFDRACKTPDRNDDLYGFIAGGTDDNAPYAPVYEISECGMLKQDC